MDDLIDRLIEGGFTVALVEDDNGNKHIDVSCVLCVPCMIDESVCHAAGCLAPQAKIVGTREPEGGE